MSTRFIADVAYDELPPALFPVTAEENKVLHSPYYLRSNARKRPQVMTEIDVAQPIVPTAVPTVEANKLLAGRWVRRILSQEEYDLYVNTWNKWLSEHKEDWVNQNDLRDLHVICMEIVREFRIELTQFRNPNVDYSDQLQKCDARMQKARQNLTARRVDHVGTKDKSSSVTNIAIMAGNVPDALMQMRNQKILDGHRRVTEFLISTEKKDLPMIDAAKQETPNA